MASIKNLKKELMYTYGALLDQCYIVEMVRPSADKKTLESLCSEIEQEFMTMTDKASVKKGIENKAAYLKGIRAEFEASVETFVNKINTLVKA